MELQLIRLYSVLPLKDGHKTDCQNFNFTEKEKEKLGQRLLFSAAAAGVCRDHYAANVGLATIFPTVCKVILLLHVLIGHLSSEVERDWAGRG